MPRGTLHIETGTLGWDARNRLHVLQMPGGGYWHLDMPGRTRRLIGREVTIEGMRSGFNLLDVSSVLAVDGRPTARRARSRLCWLIARFRHI